MALIELNSSSPSLQGMHTTHIIVQDVPYGESPREFYESHRKLKVLWLLHGGSDDSSTWVRRTKIETYACERNLIVVMPSASNSRFSNCQLFGNNFNAYDYLTEELMPMIYNWYPASDRREDNYIGGFSMGGEGALKFAVNHPDKFAGVAVLGAAARDYYHMDHDRPLYKKYMEIYSSFEEFAASYENLWDRLEDLKDSPVCPDIFGACGTSDNLAYEAFKDFRKRTEELGLKSHFETIDGYGHEWRFVDIYIEKALDYFGLNGTLDRWVKPMG